MTTTAKRILHARLEQHKTQREIAEFLNITPQAYSLIETGKTHLDIDRLKQIATFFNVSVEYLTAPDDSATINNYQHDSQFTVTTDPKVIAILETVIANQRDEIMYLRKKLDNFY